VASAGGWPGVAAWRLASRRGGGLGVVWRAESVKIRLRQLRKSAMARNINIIVMKAAAKMLSKIENQRKRRRNIGVKSEMKYEKSGGNRRKAYQQWWRERNES
jgi:hypothetical protein